MKDWILRVQPIVKHRVSFHLSIRFYRDRVAVLNSREWNEQCCDFAEVFWRRRKARHPLTESRNYFVTATTMPIEANRSAPDRPQQFRSFSFVEEQWEWMVVFQRRYFSLLRVSLTPVSPLAYKYYSIVPWYVSQRLIRRYNRVSTTCSLIY